MFKLLVGIVLFGSVIVVEKLPLDIVNSVEVNKATSHQISKL